MAYERGLYMPKINHILFPVDFSERCCHAVPFVKSMASRYGARITLLSVMQPLYYSAIGDSGGLILIDSGELLADLKARLNSSLLEEFPLGQVERLAEEGDPAQVIADFAHIHGVDLIMMPTHGYGPFRRLLLGSVTAKVLHDVRCPVWTAAHAAEPPDSKHVAFHNILCAVDGTPDSGWIMKWAAGLSKDTGATLRFVNVVPGTDSFPSRYMDREFEETLRSEARKSIERLEASIGIEAPICIAAGNVAGSIREEARRAGADLIVIGRGRLHETLGRLRTNSYNIIRQSPCPVVSV
jgi:nucleotide-binding universal stress UspA family protein